MNPSEFSLCADGTPRATHGPATLAGYRFRWLQLLNNAHAVPDWKQNNFHP
jgi:hypothetical protein